MEYKTKDFTLSYTKGYLANTKCLIGCFSVHMFLKHRIASVFESIKFAYLLFVIYM